MKKLIVFLLGLLLAVNALTQTPTGFSYQAVLRNSSGSVLVNQSGQLKISLTSSNGLVTHYQETHNIITNPQGIVNINIGDGINKVGILSDVPWEKDQI